MRLPLAKRTLGCSALQSALRVSNTNVETLGFWAGAWAHATDAAVRPTRIPKTRQSLLALWDIVLLPVRRNHRKSRGVTWDQRDRCQASLATAVLPYAFLPLGHLPMSKDQFLQLATSRSSIECDFAMELSALGACVAQGRLKKTDGDLIDVVGWLLPVRSGEFHAI